MGPIGPTGVAGSGGLLKFSGTAGVGAGSVTSYLGDAGAGTAASAPLRYPLAVGRSLVNLVTNVQLSAPIPVGGSVRITLLQNGGAIFQTVYNAGQSGIMSVVGTQPYGFEDLLDLEVVTNLLGGIDVQVSAVVGVQ